MLSENDHIPLLNKVAQGLYPSGSTIKPAMALAFLKQGVDPERRVHCAGGYRSSIAASLLQRHGFAQVGEIAGGIAAWETAKLPLET